MNSDSKTVYLASDWLAATLAAHPYSEGCHPDDDDAATWPDFVRGCVHYSSAAGLEIGCREHLRHAQVNFVYAPWNLFEIRRLKYGDFEPWKMAIEEGRQFRDRPNVTLTDIEGPTEFFTDQLRRLNVRALFYHGAKPSNVSLAPGVLGYPLFFGVARKVSPAAARDVLFSFAGGARHFPDGPLCEAARVRTRLFEMFRGSPNFIETENFHMGLRPEKRKVNADRFDGLMARSRFALCPAGSMPQTIRFYEALAAGAIPVVIADEWLPPQTWDWSATCLHISSSEFLTMRGSHDVLLGLIEGALEREDEMRANCLRAAAYFQVENLGGYIAAALAKWQSPADAEHVDVMIAPEKMEAIIEAFARHRDIGAACASVGESRHVFDAALRQNSTLRARWRALQSR